MARANSGHGGKGAHMCPSRDVSGALGSGQSEKGSGRTCVGSKEEEEEEFLTLWRRRVGPGGVRYSPKSLPVTEGGTGGPAHRNRS